MKAASVPEKWLSKNHSKERPMEDGGTDEEKQAGAKSRVPKSPSKPAL
jgi:hypothetical protein